MYASTAVYLVCSFIGFVLPSIAVVPQFHAERIGIFMLIFWSGGGCLLFFLNGVIWRNDEALNNAPILCDITVYFYAAMHGGTFASILCIIRRLHILLDLTSRTPSAQEKRRMIVTDLLITLGIPLVYVGVYYVNAGYRANIFEEVGCLWAPHITLVSIITLDISALILALVSVVYGVRNLIKIRRIYSEMRATEYFNGDATANRYFRVMALSCVDLFFTVPSLLFMTVWDSRYRSPWTSWADTKLPFSRADTYPSAIWRTSPEVVASVELGRWAPVMAAFVWLVFFGYTNETRRLYGPILRRIWESTPFATRRPALEPLAFGSLSQPLRRHGEISDLSGLSTGRSDEGIQQRTNRVPAPLDIESRVGNEEGSEAHPGPSWRICSKGATVYVS